MKKVFSTIKRFIKRILKPAYFYTDKKRTRLNRQHRNINTIEQKGLYYHSIINNTISGIIIVDEKGLIETINHTAETLFGYIENELIGKPISTLIYKYGDEQQDNYNLNYLKKTGSKIIGLSKEAIGLRKDGLSFPIKIGISEVKVNNRTVLTWMINDLTEEKKAEKALHNIEEQYKNTFDQIPIGIANTGANSKFTKMNQAFCNLFGYSEKELANLTFNDLTYPDDIEKSKLKIENTEEKKVSKYAMEKRYVKKNGEIIWGKVTITVLKNNLDHTNNKIVTIEDITLRKQAEANLENRSKEVEGANIALEKSKSAAISIMQDAQIQKKRAEKAHKELEISNQELKKLNYAIEQSFTTIVITNKIGVIEYVNPAFTASSGYTFDEIVGKTLYTLKYSEHTQKFYDDIWQTILEGKTWRGDVIHKKKTGEKYWESVSISPIYNDHNEITHFVAVKEDITKRKFLQDELIKSKEIADKANAAKSSFLTNMSHEIRTPMNAILGFSEILSKNIKDESHLEYLESIQSSGKTLLTLINDILDLSKIESGKFGFNYEPIPIKLLVQEVISMLIVKANEKGLKLNLVISDNLPNIIIVDELRIKQILINLINNAIKFTDQGYIEVEIASQNISNKLLDLVLKVKDTGIGIPKRSHEKIFQTFDQMEMQDNKKYEGTGLGLAITQQLVKLMNGTISLESTEGEGSTFTVTLGRIKVSKDTINVEEKVEIDPNLIQFEKSSILIIDDIKNNRDLLKEYVKSYNITTIEAENGKEGLIAIDKHKPDLVFLDLRMPVMDGFETNDQILKNPEWSHIPIIAITASVFNKDEQKVIHKGFNGYVKKPANLMDILKILKKHLKHTIDSKPKTSIKENTLKPIRNLNDLILEIQEKAIPHWEATKNVRRKREVLLLADRLIEIGKKYNEPSLITYGEELQLVCKSFNITKEKKLIQQLPIFIKKLNSRNNGK